jgi:holo-[acyl-carrier protein] synthase
VICGLGSDVVEITRIHQAYERLGDAFLRRILSPRECAEAEGYVLKRRVEFVAGRFAAKEAIGKALGCGIGRLGMTGVDISLAASGLRVRFEGAAAVYDKPGERWNVSISHSTDIAFAVAVWERQEG